MSSRIMVKNLPKYVTKERIKSHFGGRGTITDIKLVKTKDGNSRRFCYIGFKTDKEGLEAVRYFHNTFMDTCRLSCEVAKSIGDETIDRPWSKYSEGSSLFKKQNETQPENNIEESGIKMNKKQKEFLKDLEEDDPEFKEFLTVMENRGKRVWGNDDAAMDNGIAGNTIIECTKDDEYEDLPQVLNHDDKSVDSVDDQKPKDEKKIALDSSISDLEYLRLLKEKSSEEVVTETVKVHPGRLAILQEAGVLGNDVENCYKDYSTEPAKSEGADKVQKVEEIVAPTYLEPPPPDLIAETGRIMVRNLAYSCTYEDLQSHFQRFGLIAEIHLPMDKITKESKGYAFILYVLPESAVKAFIELDKSIFQGRIIEIVAAKEKPKTKDELEEAQTFKELREKQKKKNASNDFNWNSLFMNSDAVAEAMARKLGVKKAEILDSTTEDMAVRLALAETNIINETKEYFVQNGISLDSFGQSKKKSPTVILVKNIPGSTEENEIIELFKPFGDLGRIVLPPARTIAIIEFPDRNEAKVAFRKLAYKKFKNLPLYLEWAPENIFDEEFGKFSQEKSLESLPEQAKTIVDSQDMDLTPAATVFVKNLNFSTTDEGFKSAFSPCDGLRSAKISFKKNVKSPKNMLSMGFGFLEFDTKENAMACIKTMQHFKLDNHELQLKFSNSASKPANRRKRTNAEERDDCTKLLVRNLPFEATKKDLKLLFSSFGSVKTIRIPRKFDGQHRGFGFVDFLTPQEAKNAFESLGATHLYGRHLVIEWAKEEDTIEEIREKTAKSFVKASKKRKVGIEDEEWDEDY